jgi:hypothetical protein
MTVPVLPTINNNRVPGGAAGSWTVLGRSLLDDVSDGLDLGVSRKDEIYSVPSPWSRALQYISAFKNEKYPTRDWLISQYRGLLAALALSDILHLELTAHHINLANPIKFKFQYILNALIPMENERANGWNDIYVLRMKQRVIGFTSPATLVVPASYIDDSGNLLSNEVAWIQDGHFNDPVAVGMHDNPVGMLSPFQKASLSAWINNLRELRELDNDILGVLAEFSKELGQPNTYIPSRRNYGISEQPKQLSGLYPIGLIPGNEQSSNVEVKTRSKAPTKKLYLYDNANIAKRLGKYNTEVHVVGGLSLNDFTPEKGSAVDPNALFLQPANLFLENLYYVKNRASEGTFFPHNWLADHLDNFEYSILLPISQDLMQYFTSEELRDMLSFDKITNNGKSQLRVKIRIPLSGFKDVATEYEIVRLYSFLPECELKESMLPSIALWPYVFDPRRLFPGNNIEWSKYYIFVRENSRDKECAFRVKIDSCSEKSVYNTEEGLIRYWELSHIPDFISAQKSDGTFLGFIPIDTPRNSNINNSEMVIGVDFGTSLTNVAISLNQNQAMQLELKPLLLPITKNNSNSLFTLLCHFIPESFPGSTESSTQSFQTPPIPTLLITQGNSANTENNNGFDVITSARIFHASAGNSLNDGSIRANLKWLEPQYVQPFLMQLTLLISAHALNQGVTSLRWRITYPTAFSGPERDRYVAYWNETISWLSECTGQVHQFDELNDVVTESIACASYFKGVKRAEIQHSCTVDIGGGTTDICFFSRETPVHQVSVRYAGRDIFHRLLNPFEKQINNPFVRHILGENFNHSSLSNFESYNADSAWDLWMREHGEEYLRSMDFKKSCMEPVAIIFRSHLALSIGGLYYYIGLVNQYLNEEGKMNAYKNAVSLLIGGNGSRFFHWLSPTAKFGKSEAESLLNNLLQSASNLGPSSFGTQITNDPKAEACLGLANIASCQELSAQVQPVANSDKPFMGLACSISGKMKETDERVILKFKASDRFAFPPNWAETKSITITDFGPLESFVCNFNSHAGTLQGIHPITTTVNGKRREFVQITENQQQRLREYVAGALQSKLRSPSFRPEPVFFTALKCLNRILAEDIINS